PQAAWLRAEVERSWAARFARVEPRDEARAAAAWRTAHALDGGRVAGVGETDLGPRKRLPVSVLVEGSHLSSVSVRLDGLEIARGADSSDTRANFTAEASAAEHQLVAYADGEAVFAQWVGIAEGGATAPIAIHLANAAGTCTRDAFASVARDGSNIRAIGVTCPKWAAAVPTDHAGAVLVARCERDACGPLLEWRVERWTDSGAPQPFPRAKPWPAWATWTLVGIGAATAT